LSFLRIIIRIFLSVIILTSIYFEGYAQERTEGQPLSTILQSLEQQYSISFTFADVNISGIFIEPPTVDLGLEKKLQYLEKVTGLIFHRLDNRFIAISKPVGDKDLCGYVLDIITGEKLRGATIQSGNNVAVTDTEGFFRLVKPMDSDSIRISFLGYQADILAVGSFPESGCDTFFLRQQSIRLPELIVNNYIVQGIDKKADGSFRIDTEELGILPGLIEPDVLLTVQALPGIQSVSETVSNLNIRGGTHDQNLIIWDGIKMYQSDHFFGLISAFNPYLTRNVTLIKNGTSARYDDGISGTINMQTDTENISHFSGGAGVNMINADMFARIPAGRKISLQVSARRSIADRIETPAYREYYDRAFRDSEVINMDNDADSVITSDENFNFYDFSLNLRYAVTEVDEIKVNFIHVNNKIDYRENSQYDTLVESRTSGLKQESTGASLIYNRDWNEKIQTMASVYLSAYNLNAVNHDIFNDQRLTQENEVLENGLRIESLIKFDDRLHLRTGYQFSETGIGNLEDINKPVFRRYIKEVVRSHSAYTEADMSTSNEKTHIIAGVRLNYLPKFGLFLPEPRIVLNHQLFRNFTLELLGELKSQHTTQVIDFQHDFLGIEKRRWILSNEADIPVVRSRQLSLGGHYQKRSVMVSVEGYYKKVDGIITSSQGFQNQFQYIRSAGSYDIAGMDILLNRQFRKLSTWLSYSLARNMYTFPDLEPAEFPSNLDIRHVVTTGGSYQTNTIHVAAGISWHSGIPFTAPSSQEPVKNNEIYYMDPNTSRLDDYLRLDLSAKYLIFLGQGETRLEIGASCWNLLDRRNVINVHYTIDDQGDVEEIRRYSLGFTPNFMLRYMF
jgi:hypothetical protein